MLFCRGVLLYVERISSKTEEEDEKSNIENETNNVKMEKGTDTKKYGKSFFYSTIQIRR